MDKGEIIISARHRSYWKACSGRRIITILISLSLLFVCFGSAIVPAHANSKETIVRVGYFNNGDFMHKDQDGSYAGYDIEFYYMLAGYENWKVKIIEFNNLDQATAALKKGTIEILSGLSMTPQRQHDFIASAQKMCTTRIAVQTRANDDRYSAGNTSTMKKMTCGILKGSNVVTLYQTWCKSNNLTPHIIEYNSLDECNQAFEKKEVDAVAAGSTIINAQKIAEFPGVDLYFMLNKKKTGIKKQLDQAMATLFLQQPTYTTSLFNRYFPATRNIKPSFSKEEKAYIKAHKTIKVALLGDDAPFSLKNADGTMSGILPSYYDHLSQIIGIQFQCVAYDSKEKLLDAITQGKAALAGKLDDDIFDANKHSLILTNGFLSMNLVQLTKAGTTHVSTVAVPQCNISGVKGYVNDTRSALQLKTYANSVKCFDALKDNSVDAIVCTQPAATYLLNHNRASEYSLSIFDTKEYEVACGMKLGTQGNLLRSILNKTIAVDSSSISQIIDTVTSEDAENISTFINRLSVTTIVLVGALAFLIVIILIAALLVIVRRHHIENTLHAKQILLASQEEANKARHAFFGTVSHDMRTPLNGIVGFMEMALKSNDVLEIKDYLTKIETSSSILSHLVNDTLIMSRIENGQYVLAPSPVNLKETTEEILEPIKEMAKQKEVIMIIGIGVDIDHDVMLDRLSYQKIILNLLTNALKFTPPQGTVNFTLDFDEKGTHMKVSDTGIGISEKFLPHVFESFAQENPDNSATSGSGLGLSIVKNIVDAMHGTITVESQKGEGTTFICELPLSTQDIIEKQENEETQMDLTCLKDKQVLVCEDNALNL